jgi:Family of unknown function (DUF6441)
MTFKLLLSALSGDFEESMRELELPIATASTATMDEVAEVVKREGRSDIGRAGFSVRWQNALRVDRYPRGSKKSVDAAVFLFHRIVYAGIFEDGGRIAGQPLLWVPLDSTPKKIGRNRMTAANFGRLIGPLTSLSSRTGTPLLGAPVRLSRTQAASDRPKITLAALRRGKSGTGILRTVPMFVGIRVANMRKQLNIRQICERAQSRIPAIYASKFRA